MTSPSFDRAQAQYDAQTPPYDEEADCTCTPDEIAEDLVSPDCQRHSEPPCPKCGWQAVCPDCIGT